MPTRKVAKKYGISRDSAYRHKKKMPPQLITARLGEILKPGADLEKLWIEESEGLLANLATQRVRLLRMQDLCLEDEDEIGVGRLAGHIHRNIELVGKYLGEFASRSVQTSISLLITPE